MSVSSEDDEPPVQFLADHEWTDQYLQGKEYTELIDYLDATVFTGFPHVHYPKVDTLHVVLTIATISPHYHHITDLTESSMTANIGIYAARYLEKLGSMLTISDVRRGNDAQSHQFESLYAPVEPSSRELEHLKRELFKILDEFDPAKISAAASSHHPLVTEFFNEENGRADQRRRSPAARGDSPMSSEEEEEAAKTPLKKQLDLLYERIGHSRRDASDSNGSDTEVDNDEDDVYTPPRGSFKRQKLHSTRNSTPEVSTLPDEIFRNRLLYKQVDHDFWRLVRWGLFNSSARVDDLKSQCIWETWRPILKFLLDVAISQFEYHNDRIGDEAQNENFILSAKLHLKKHTFIAKLLKKFSSADHQLAFSEYIDACFFNQTSRRRAIPPVYDQELHHNHRVIITANTEDKAVDDTRDHKIKLGLSSIPFRRDLLFLAYRYACSAYSSSSSSSAKYRSTLLSSKEAITDVFLDQVRKELFQLSYREFTEFFVEDASQMLKNYKMEFLAAVCVNALQFYDPCDAVIDVETIEDYVKTVNDLLYATDLAGLINWQEKCDPVNRIMASMSSQVTFTSYYEIHRKTLVCFSILLNYWLKSNQVDSFEQRDHALSLLRIGDEKRAESLESFYAKMKSDAALTSTEAENYGQGKYQMVSLREIFEAKLTCPISNDAVVSSSSP